MTLALYAISGLALSADSFAASLSLGVQKLSRGKKLFFTLCLSFFQAGLPLLALFFVQSVDSWLPGLYQMDHWLAFALLHYFGIEMILDSRKDPENLPEPAFTKIPILAFASSIDAFAFGLSVESLKLQALPLFISVFFISLASVQAGFYLGGKGQKFMGRYALAFGGLILIGLAWSILIQHLELKIL